MERGHTHPHPPSQEPWRYSRRSRCCWGRRQRQRRCARKRTAQWTSGPAARWLWGEWQGRREEREPKEWVADGGLRHMARWPSGAQQPAVTQPRVSPADGGFLSFCMVCVLHTDNPLQGRRIGGDRAGLAFLLPGVHLLRCYEGSTGSRPVRIVTPEVCAFSHLRHAHCHT